MMYSTWFPTLERTLMCLSRIYLNVEMSVFEDLAQEAVTVCSDSLHSASREISSRHGQQDGELFLIKSLLTLREQIAPFDADIATTQKSLDFTPTAGALNWLLGEGTNSLLSFGANNAVLGFLQRGLPSVTQSQRDSKKDLEANLKMACNIFIDNTTQQIIAGLLAFLEQAHAQQQAAGSAAQPLRDAAFASIGRLSELIAQVKASFCSVMPGVTEKLELYLANPVTQRILLKPVQAKVLDAVGKFRALLEVNFEEAESRAVRDALQEIDQLARELGESTRAAET